ncbi:MAG: CoA-binding protein [Planctomycetota bacterium]
MDKPTIAIIGASSNPEKFGNKAVRAYLRQGYEVYPVNPKGGEIEGLAAFQAIGDVPAESLDRISLYVPPPVGLGLIDEIAAKGCRELWLNPGSESPELVERAEAAGLNPVVACSIVDIGASPKE